MHRLVVLVILAGCGGSARPAAAPPPPPPPPVEIRQPPVADTGASAGSAHDVHDQVAISGDPCEGGQITGAGLDAGGAGEGGGGTGEGISLGSIGTKGSGAGQGYGAGHGKLGGRASSPTVRDGNATVSGSLDQAIIRRVIKRSINQLRYCYEKGLVSNPALKGTSTAKFVIDAKGAVVTATASGLDASVDACIAHVLQRLEFPAPAGGGNVVVTYPFAFAPE